MAFVKYDLMSGMGFEGGAFSMDWVMAWVGLLLLCLIWMFAKKWLGEEEVAGISYNWIASCAGILAYYISISLMGNSKISLAIGLGVLLLAGFGVGQFIEGGGGD